MKDRDELDPIDRAMLEQGSCSDCGGMLVPGPRGGAAQNFYCTNRDDCRAGFNLTFHSGKLIFSERIGEVADATFAMYADGRR